MSNTLDGLASTARDRRMHGGRWVRDSYNPTKFDGAARAAEVEHGSDAVWSRVRNELFETNDEYVRGELIESYGNSPVSDALKRQLLEDLVLDPSIDISSKKTAMVELREYVEDDEWPKFLKGLYYRVDARTQQAFFHALVMPDFDASGIRNRATDGDVGVNLKKLVWLFCDMAAVWPRDRLLDIVMNDYAPKYGEAKVAEVLRFVTGHEYCTAKTRECALHTLTGIGL